MLKKVVYNLLFAVVYPFLLPGFLVRMLRRGGYAARMGDRFALYPDEVLRKFREGGFVWIHAVSVGEVQVAGQLMREWRKVEPGVKFAFSTTSSTGWKMAEKEISERDVLIYNPLDFPNFVKSALKTVRPRAVVLTESEIWPNFIWTAQRYRIPVFLVNARVSDRSAPRYRAARWFFGDVLASFARIFAQSDLDATRLVAAGAPERIVEVTGSFKFDVAHRNEAKERELREWIGPGRILLGGSTWPGEDEALLRIYSDIAKSQGGVSQVKLVIAPRHFEKADAVEENIKSAGFSCVRRSIKDSPTHPLANSSTPVYLADTTGELMGLYGIADVVFVGKSLCAHGSQNMIEPCLCGKPTAVGPYTENFRPVMSDLLDADAIVQAAPQLLTAAIQLLVTLGGAIISNLPRLGEACFKIVGKIVDGVRSLKERIQSIGKDIVLGIWQGISSMVSWFTDKVKGFFSGIVNGVKNTLGIHSPSTVFAGIGENMGKGLGVGFESSMEDVKRQMQAAMPGLEGAVSVNAAGGPIQSGGSGADLAAAVAAALNNAAVYMDQHKVGRLITIDQQSAARRGLIRV